MNRDAYADIRCWGGDMMQQAGAKLVKHYRELAFMGFTEVIKNLPTILRNIKFCKQDILGYQPDAVILIDYPGFNLRIAKWAKQQGIKVIYYISPQVWAWKENRVKMMKKCIDKMLVILPFEKEYYKNKWDWEVEYVGHPLVEVIDRFLLTTERTPTENIDPDYQKSGIIALLPGSRQQEIAKKLPIMLEVSTRFPNYQFIIAQAPAIEDEFYKNYTAEYSNVSFVKNKTYDLLSKAKAALVTSGTATLETALFGVPEVVCYKGSPVSYQIAKRVIKVKFISLVNLIMDRLIVKELIQDELNSKNLKEELSLILTDEFRIAEIKKDYAELKELLSKGGNASAKAAESVFNYLGK
jgi:lipid-A-disaccharide synthase